jgi:enterochelin esterase family protein
MRRYAYVVVLLAAVPAAAQDMVLDKILAPGEGWQVALKDCKSARALASDGKGNVYVADPDGMQIWRIDKDGKTAVFCQTAAAVRGLACGPDGKLIASQPDKQRVVVPSADGQETVLSDRLAVTDLAVTAKGAVYAAAPGEKAVYLLAPDGKRRQVDQGITSPGGLALTPDGGTLVVGDVGGRHLYALRVRGDGDLDAKEDYFPLRLRGAPPSGNGGVTADAAGRVYATTRDGVQAFDPTGRLIGVLTHPEPGAAMGGVAFGGADLDRLYVACGGKVYVRKVQAKGVAAKPAP